MKKYQQLLLAVVSIFSFGCLLLYRHEYYKLRYVLEVLDFFVAPGASTNSTVCSLPNSFNEFARGPFPAWQRITDSLYVYSAFWEVDNEKYVKAYAVGILNRNFSYECYLWYNFKRVEGKFKYMTIDYEKNSISNQRKSEKRKAKAFVFYCEAHSMERPTGVTFFSSYFNETSVGFLPVVTLKPNFLQTATAVCVMPTSFPEFSESQYLEFLNFHKVIGLNKFIIYGGIENYNLLSSVHNHQANDIKLTVLPWNYPYYEDSELGKIIAENDCRTRITGMFENVIILEWNKFLVPQFLYNLVQTFNELDHHQKVNKFLFKTLIFCLEYKDEYLDPKSPIIFRKMKYSLPKIDIPVPLYRPNIKSRLTQNIGKGIIAVHQYANCSGIKHKLEKKERIDKSIIRFQKEYLSQALVV